MKKVLSIALLLTLLIARGFSQTAIPNASFENWENSGANIEPVSWNSNKSGTGNAPSGPQTCFQSNMAHSGNYSAKVESAFYIVTVVNGSLTTGQVCAPTFTKSDGYISSRPGNSGYITTFTGRPDSLIFWYQYTSVSSDYPTVEARLHLDSAFAPEAATSYHPACAQNIVGRALWQGPSSSSTGGWQRVSVPFVYADNRTPGYILITTTSSGNQSGGSSGSTLYLDDFLAYYIPVLSTGSVSTGPYYVSATNSTSISVPFTLTGTVDSSNVVTAQLSDGNGSFATPVTIGSVAALSSGTITATIPAGTPTGTGYRVRVIANHPVLTAADNGSNITIDLVSNSVAPATTQNIAANTNGNALTVTETPAATSRQWEYATTSGGPYTAFSIAQTGTSYTPNFATAATYYVVCVSSYPGNLTATSNQVQINVVSNSIAPTSSQSLLTGVNGTTLTVTESATASSRTWKYSTTSGSGYVGFGTAQTGTTYTPNFASAGTYYVVCQSIINGVTATSNEVLVSVGNATITTQAVTGSPFLFSPSAPAASVTVPYVTSGTFSGGNTFTAQLSNAAGSFASPVVIGSQSGTTSGSISASIPSATAAGTGYRIRVVSSNPVVLGSDNGTDLVVDQFHASIAPASTQTIALNTNGTTLAVTASQTATYNWKYSTTSGNGYVDFSTAQTGSTYTPNFATPGNYYVVCVSTNQYSDAVTSNEVEIIVENGTSLTTLAIAGSPFLVSDSAHVLVDVNYTSDAQFNTGNVFQAQLSDNAGGFTNPTIIGSLTGTASAGTVSAVIPNYTAAGTHYRIRVVSSNPAINGTPDSTDLTVIPFAVTVSPVDTQYLIRHQNGNLLTATSSQPATYDWQFSNVPGTGYVSFIPARNADTITPNFNNIDAYYVVCNVKNALNVSILTPEVVIIVTQTNAITHVAESTIKAYWDNNQFVVDLNDAKLKTPVLQLMSVTGQVVLQSSLNPGTVNRVDSHVAEGIYVFKITDGDQIYTGKTAKK